MALRGAGRAEGSGKPGEVPVTVPAAFYVCALGTYDDIKAMLARADRTGVAGLLLAAIAWQCEGDVTRAESALRRAAENAVDDDRPYVIDMLAPLLLSRGLFTRGAALLATTSSSTLAIGRKALSAMVDAAIGNRAASAETSIEVREALVRLDDDVLRMRVHQRLAFAAYYRGDVAEALAEVAEGVRCARLLRAHRSAATLHSVAYATHHTLTGDLEAAWRNASDLVCEATLGGDSSYRALGLVAIYEMSAERGEDAELAAARAALDAELLPEQYCERFAAGIADALRLAWNADYTTARNALTVLKDTTGRTDAERAICRALLALTAIALGDDDAARRFSRQAISGSARPEKRLPAHQLRYRRLARALAAVAGELVGDLVRGRRAGEARFLHGDPDIATLLHLRDGAALGRVPKSVRGYARFVLIARDRIASRPAAGPLTAAEIEVLRLVADGRNAPQIATMLDRSPHTVRTHLRNISAKLDTHGRIDTLARARCLGVLV